MSLSIKLPHMQEPRQLAHYSTTTS